MQEKRGMSVAFAKIVFLVENILVDICNQYMKERSLINVIYAISSSQEIIIYKDTLWQFTKEKNVFMKERNHINVIYATLIRQAKEG